MKTKEYIEKEQINSLNFSKQEVLQSYDEKKSRLADLHRSQTLGNLLHSKVHITFQSANEQVYEVYTTVWAVASEFIVLKGGVTIPINSILKVE
ncbi:MULTISPECIES: hypothetical protein [Algoriphagus]|jgi:hypothetical protein|uniref:Uncharacterized protein n=1 Tax=Algoriphagus zhangzhouensis TaxID=1073327 RepID=A0A1M7ZJR7_9BACT|nr:MULTISPECIES: hypothetical protein [Algoriphagus]TDY43532.1 hypothetical protein A8938_3631 [Algoriphagus zhangzhouensis]SHO65052.1 hypothetical protein SAMN04488108_3829 [Algoriphagus zhangzhouensis]